MGRLRFLSSGEPDKAISDERFGAQLKEVQALKKFLFEEKVQFSHEQIEAIDLGPLNNLTIASRGRQPTDDEWKLLDLKLWALSSLLSEDLRQKVRIRELGVFFGTIPIVFLAISLASLVVLFVYTLVFSDQNSVPAVITFLLSLIAWSVSQGGLGACAFLGTRVAIKRAEGKDVINPSDESADVTNRNVLKIRIVLGCLFASLVGLPISNLAMLQLSNLIFSKSDTEWNSASFSLILIPFMIGFSTNLVLGLLDRFIISVRTLFGIGST